MAIYFKIQGVWTQVQRPYVKRNGVWTPVNETWRRSDGTWKKVFTWDVTPPPAPSLTLDLAPNAAKGRYIAITVVTPSAPTNAAIAMTRVLVSRTAYPATQYGGTYYSYPDKARPNEPWSDLLFPQNHASPATPVQLQWPPNGYTTSNVPAGPFYVQAWNQDVNGNWSAGIAVSFTVPKAGVGTSQVITRDARFTPIGSGTFIEGSGFAIGDLQQSINPQKRAGAFLYGPAFVNEIGRYYSNVSVKSAQIYLQRIDTDGPATADITMFRHGYNTTNDVTGGLLSPGPTQEPVLLGTLAKGQGAWFKLPELWYGDLAAGGTRGFGFGWRRYGNAAATASDYSVISGQTEANIRHGELAVVWTETQ